MNILHVSAECYPFIKIGGLADVVGSLPSEIKRLRGCELRVVLPKYKSIPKKYLSKMKHFAHHTITLGNQCDVYVGIETLKLGNILYYFIDNQFYFGSRDQVYGYGDDSERFAYFQKAVVESIPFFDFKPDVIHCHDWHTGMVPLLVKYHKDTENIKTVFSIHNLAYQGIFPIDHYQFFNIPYDGRFEYEGFVNFLKTGIVSADFITTVSKTYSDEILTDYYGYGMQKLLKARKNQLVGILNGISYQEFDPKSDSLIAFPYTLENVKEGKIKNKEALYQSLDISFSTSKPLIAVISRLVNQKGFDLVQRVFDEMLETDDFVFVVLGTGELIYEDYFKSLEKRFPDKVKSIIGYSNQLAHLLYASSDFFLMPSKFEPCGLGQIIALKYGSLPIVRETGGLKDTITPYNEYEGTGNGFSFSHYNAHDMMHVIRYALKTYWFDTYGMESLVKNAMNCDFSWTKSAKEYKKLYKEILG